MTITEFPCQFGFSPDDQEKMCFGSKYCALPWQPCCPALVGGKSITSLNYISKTVKDHFQQNIKFCLSYIYKKEGISDKMCKVVGI